MRTLFLIPARGGSKGIPRKNIKPLCGKPLINYSIDVARAFAEDSDIFLSTDSEEIKSVAEAYGLKVPFLRPAELATDTATGYDMIMHAIGEFERRGVFYDTIVQLQPTSPLRTVAHVQEGLALYNSDLDMVVSVVEMYNPVYWSYKENSEGLLEKVAENTFARRQDIPKIFKLNGAIFIMNVASLKREKISAFKKIKKITMDDHCSVDLDTPLDWDFCEFLMNKKV